MSEYRKYSVITLKSFIIWKGLREEDSDSCDKPKKHMYIYVELVLQITELI